MTESYVAQQIPLVQTLATLLDWAFLLNVVLAGVMVLFALWTARLRRRVRELEQQLTEAQVGSKPPTVVNDTPTFHHRDDKHIPLTSFSGELNAPRK